MFWVWLRPSPRFLVPVSTREEPSFMYFFKKNIIFLRKSPFEERFPPMPDLRKSLEMINGEMAAY